MVTRRKFIQSFSMLAAGLGTYRPLFGFFSFNSFPCFDLHAHPGIFFAKGSDQYPGDAAVMKTLTEMKDGNVAGTFLSLVADARIIKVSPDGVRPFGNFAKGEAWMDYKRQLGLVREVLQNSLHVVMATEKDSFDKNPAKVSAFISIEGGDYLEGDAGRLEEMYNDGIRSIQLVHYHPNELGDLQTEVPQHNGLSPAGKEAVKRMNKLGMLVDVAHASYETTKAVADVTTHPIMLSHSMLYNGSQHPVAKRMLSPDHARAVADTGGIIGMWPSGLNASLSDFVDNTMRLIDVVGIDHVGLGTDMDANFRPVLSSYLEVGQWLNGLQSKGLNENETAKIAGGNARRVLNQVLRS
ncbi:MAG: dipeptidase [Cyclobacteriaceae bacterium]